MSTLNTISTDCRLCGGHMLRYDIEEDLHEPEGTIRIIFHCSTCNCSYTMIVTRHIGNQIALLLKYGEKYIEEHNLRSRWASTDFNKTVHLE